MPPKKVKIGSRSRKQTKEAKKKAARREAEDVTDRERRLDDKRKRSAASREAEDATVRERRLEEQRNRTTANREAEDATDREKRLEKKRNRTETSRAVEDQQQQELRRRTMREKATASRSRALSSLSHEGLNYNEGTEYAQHSKVIIGGMTEVCKHCSAKKYPGETAGMCCKNGKVKLPDLENPPDQLQQLMSGDSANSRHFLKNMRKYNSCFQMTSFGATNIVDQQGFATTFKVQGQVYHRAGSLLPMPDQKTQFLQLYFIGNEEMEANQRCEIIPNTKQEIVISLQAMLHEHNALVKTFKTALEEMPTDEYKIVISADRTPAGEHAGRYNAPTANEVAVILTGEFEKRDIVLHRRNEGLQRIAETHRSYDALQYPLMFPRGEDGYHFKIMQVNPATGEPSLKKVSCMDFYSYRMMLRATNTNHLLNCRQVFSQFVVDMYAKVETERLRYIRLNQSKLRAEEYIHLKDAIRNDGKVDDIGKLVILPASFTGSPRHMAEYTQDAMTYVRKYGKPDLFITFTCNPAWQEIKDELVNGQAPRDRHDLIARVFRQKQRKFIDVLTKGQVFGETQCWMYTVEYQKRGLPHSHNLIWLKEKIRPADIDKVIRAEFPDPEQDGGLYEVVKKNMIHGPCGCLNKNSPCMKNGKCTKKYPRKLLEETQTAEDGYPQYRRRGADKGGHTAKLKVHGQEMELDNSWVVPYSPLLCKMFQAHINVEFCNSIKSIKYVCKYINKGSDMAVYTLEDKEGDRNEVAKYETGRYISSNEAVWRILGFPIHERHPTVVHLSVHLENGQRVFFTEENAARIAEEPPNTTLTAFFKLCQKDDLAKTLLYPEVVKYYTWNAATKTFSKRKAGHREGDVVCSDALGRVYTVHPNNAECFFLRMLLHTVRGPTSFIDLKTVEGAECSTYRQACQQLGLLEEDRHWDSTMNEAALVSSPSQIRGLFAIILTTCSPSDPKGLWEKYREAMSEDILAAVQKKAPGTAKLGYSAEIFNRALVALEDRCLSMTGRSLHQLGLDPVVREDGDILDADYLREKSHDVEQLRKYVQQRKPSLNEDQEKAFDTILKRVEGRRGGIVFLDAPGGTGKTYLTNLILAEIRSRGEVALAIASSGIAATLMVGGRTAHSALKLPLDIAKQENPTCNISKGSGQAKVLQSCSIIIWDECTMAHRKSLECLDTTLKDLRGNKQLMGGVLVLLCGDFRQILPVVPRGTPADEVNACLKSSTLWKRVEKIHLSRNMRLVSDEPSVRAFGETLLAIGEGKIPANPSGQISLPRDFCKMAASTPDLINSVYPDARNNYLRPEWLRERAILAPRNDEVDIINNAMLNTLPGTVGEYKSIDSTLDIEEAVNFPQEFLNSLNPAGLPPHRLRIKLGCPIILLRNLDPPKLCNGTRLCVSKMMPNVLQATILTGQGEGEVVYIPKIPLIPTDVPFSFRRLQFPIRLAFGLSINKSQGQSFRVCGVSLNVPCFSHGQLYVACSRSGSPHTLILLAQDRQTKNIVYKKVLQ